MLGFLLSTGAPRGKAEAKFPVKRAAKIFDSLLIVKLAEVFSNGPALAMLVATEPEVGVLSTIKGSILIRFSAPEIKLILPASMKEISRKEDTNIESFEKDSGPTEKAAGYGMGCPRELRIASECSASPLIASTST